MKRKFLFIVMGEFTSLLLKDIMSQPDCEILIAGRTGIGTFLLRRKIPRKILKILHLHKFFMSQPFCFKIASYDFRPDTEYFLVFIGTFAFYRPEMIEKLKKKARIKRILLILDSMNAQSYTVSRNKDIIFKGRFDGIYSFDRYDCEKFGWKYIGRNYYSKQQVTGVSEEDISDAYFVGGLKGNRDFLIYSTYERLSEKGAKVLFNLNCLSKKQFKEAPRKSGITYTSGTNIPYPDVMKKNAGTNCIIEIMQEGQRTQSIRYFEALALNKKLLTNNPDIKNLPYYDERFMKYFKTAEDIDVEWVRRREAINYNYRDDFSPLHLMEQFRRDFSQTAFEE